MCVQRGLIDYDEKVATYWPEFAAHDKGDATVAQLLSHQCGLIAPDAPVTLADALDWKTITAMLADTKPDWPIGTGSRLPRLDVRLAGRRADPPHRWSFAGPVRGRRDRRSARCRAVDRSAGGAWSRACRRSSAAAERRQPGPGDQGDDRDVPRPGYPWRAGSVPQRCVRASSDDVFNRRDVHAAEIPAANGISNAAALAKVYAATIGTGRRRAVARRRDPRSGTDHHHARRASPTCASSCRPRSAWAS